MVAYKSVRIPTWGMVASFFLGLGLVILWGMQVAVTGSEVASEFFGALAVLFTSTVIGWALLVLLLVALWKFWYVVVPFFFGIMVGLLILTFLGSSLSSGITATSLIKVHRWQPWAGTPRPPALSNI